MVWSLKHLDTSKDANAATWRFVGCSDLHPFLFDGLVCSPNMADAKSEPFISGTLISLDIGALNCLLNLVT